MSPSQPYSQQPQSHAQQSHAQQPYSPSQVPYSPSHPSMGEDDEDRGTGSPPLDLSIYDTEPAAAAATAPASSSSLSALDELANMLKGSGMGGAGSGAIAVVGEVIDETEGDEEGGTHGITSGTPAQWLPDEGDPALSEQLDRGEAVAQWRAHMLSTS